VGLRGPVAGPYPPSGAHKKKGGRGTNGAAVYYRPPQFLQSLFELRDPSLTLCASCAPPFLCHPSRRPPYWGAAAMASSRSTAVAPTEPAGHSPGGGGGGHGGTGRWGG